MMDLKDSLQLLRLLPLTKPFYVATHYRHRTDMDFTTLRSFCYQIHSTYNTDWCITLDGNASMEQGPCVDLFRDIQGVCVLQRQCTQKVRSQLMVFGMLPASLLLGQQTTNLDLEIMVSLKRYLISLFLPVRTDFGVFLARQTFKRLTL